MLMVAELMVSMVYSSSIISVSLMFELKMLLKFVVRTVVLVIGVGIPGGKIRIYINLINDIILNNTNAKYSLIYNIYIYIYTYHI